MKPGIGARVVARIPTQNRPACTGATASNDVPDRYANLLQGAIPPRVSEARLADLSPTLIRAWLPGTNGRV